jgi:hypothetical protein
VLAGGGAGQRHASVDRRRLDRRLKMPPEDEGRKMPDSRFLSNTL